MNIFSPLFATSRTKTVYRQPHVPASQPLQLFSDAASQIPQTHGPEIQRMLTVLRSSTDAECKTKIAKLINTIQFLIVEDNMTSTHFNYFIAELKSALPEGIAVDPTAFLRLMKGFARHTSPLVSNFLSPGGINRTASIKHILRELLGTQDLSSVQALKCSPQEVAMLTFVDYRSYKNFRAVVQSLEGKVHHDIADDRTVNKTLLTGYLMDLLISGRGSDYLNLLLHMCGQLGILTTRDQRSDNTWSDAFLESAAAKRDPAVFDFLLERGFSAADMLEKLLAAYPSREDKIKDLRICTLLIEAGKRAGLEIPSGSHLRFAFTFGWRDKSILELLVTPQSASSISSSGETSLHAAIRESMGFAVCELLLRRGALAVVNHPNKDGLTPLHAAAASGAFDTCELLLKHEALQVINTPDKFGNIPLHYSAKKGAPAICERFIAAGADPNAANQDGNTPFHFVVGADHHSGYVKSHTELCKFFVLHGARWNLTNSKGQTPLDVTAMTRPSQSDYYTVEVTNTANGYGTVREGRTTYTEAKHTKWLTVPMIEGWLAESASAVRT